jgi:hypothetical protein
LPVAGFYDLAVQNGLFGETGVSGRSCRLAMS